MPTVASKGAKTREPARSQVNMTQLSRHCGMHACWYKQICVISPCKCRVLLRTVHFASDGFRSRFKLAVRLARMQEMVTFPGYLKHLRAETRYILQYFELKAIF